MKKVIFSIFIALSFLVSGIVYAGPDIGFEKDGLARGVAEKSQYSVNVNDTTLSQTIGKIIGVVLTLVGTIFFVLTVYAGFTWMTAGGNEEKITEATSIVKRAVIGLIITMAAYGITTFVMRATRSSTGFDKDEQVGRPAAGTACAKNKDNNGRSYQCVSDGQCSAGNISSDCSPGEVCCRP